MLDQETKKRIDDCRNILVGKVPDPKSQVEQITIAMIYKFMYDMDKESIDMGGVSTYFVGEYEKYSWANIFNPRIGGNEMIELYGEGIVKMNLNPNIPQLFRDIFKNAFLPYRDPETLKLFLKGINHFHYSHSEKLGDAFEYLLSSMDSQGQAGQFRTPRHIIDFIVELLQPKKNERILDPACGSSGFLISSYKHILRNNTKKILGDLITPDERNRLVENISGYDISPDMVRLSLVNLYLHNFSNPKIYEYDTLTSEDKWNEYFNVILGNPPFMTPKGGIKPHKRFSIQSNRAEVLFVDYIMEHLTPNGRAGIVVPEGIIFQSGTAYKSLRKTLVEKYLVGVISLPGGVFNPYSGVKTSILIIDKELSQKTDKIFFGKVDNDGFDLGAQRREIDKNDLPILTKEVTEYLDGLRKGKIVESEKLTYVQKEQILSSSDIGLSYDRYSITKQKNTSYPIVSLKELVLTKPQYGSGAKKTNYDETNRYIRITDITEDGKLKNDELVSPDIIEEDCFLKYNDILIARSASVGRCYIHKEKYGNNQFAGYLIRFNLDTNKILPDYFFNLTKGIFYKEWISQMKKDGTISNINAQEYLSLEIPLPPIDVQEEIVRELEQYQKIIDGAKQVVDNYKSIIDIDPSWEMKELGEVSKIRGGFAFKSAEFIDKGIQVLRMSNVKMGMLELTKNPVFIESNRITEFSKYVVTKGDVLITMTGTEGKRDYGYVCMIQDETKFLLNQRIGKVEIKSNAISNKFISLILTTTLFQDELFNKAAGVRQSNISGGDLESISIPVPPLEIQQSIVERIEAERQIVEGNKKLIEIYTKKIQDRINKIWGE
jgi:type I restriction enzyme M protein